MPKSAENVRMSSIIPKGISRKLARLIERVLPLRWADALNGFRVQTRLLFSKFVLALLAAMFFFFAWATIQEEVFKEKDVFLFMLFYAVALAVILHMGLWEDEREGRTFELLLMRLPTVHRLIWFKLRVSFIWTFLLILPVFIGFSWFVSIPLPRGLLYLFFCLAAALTFALFTCVVSSFVHRVLPTGVIVLLLAFMTMGFFINAPMPYKDYYQPYLMPVKEEGSILPLKVLIVNRLVLLSVAAAFYAWFRHRIEKLEKWVL